MKKTKSIYETPLVHVEAVSPEHGFAQSSKTYNAHGLHDIIGADVTDQSGDWN